MFADSMLESSWTERSQRSWSTLTSFGLQAGVMLILLMLPLIRPVALPFLRPLTTPVSLARLPEPLLNVQPQGAAHFSQGNASAHVIVIPREIPKGIDMRPDDVPAASEVPAGPYVPGQTTGGPDGTWNSIPNSFSRAVTPSLPQIVAVHQLRISHMMEGNLIRRTQPSYPQTARIARIQGQVMLSAVISKEGTIENLHVISGHPLLVQAAIEAVRQWRYRPYVLNNEPVEVETQITVKFSLSEN
jgi:protein TonB